MIALVTAAISTSLVGVNSLQSAGNDPPTAQAKSKADLHGDPLPQGALVRMGTVRWRHGDNVTFVGFTSDGNGVLTASQDNILRLWQRETGKEVCRFTSSAAKSPLIAPGVPVAYYGRIGMAPILSPDGKVFAAVQLGNIIQMWDAANGKELRQIKAPSTGVTGMVFSPDGKMLAIQGNDRKLSFIASDTGNIIRQFNNNQPAAGGARIFIGNPAGGGGMAFSPDGKHLACAEIEFGPGKTSTYVKIADVETGKDVRRLDIANTGVSGIGYSPNGKILAYGNGNAVILSATDTGKEIRQVNMPQGVTAVLFSPQGDTLAAKGRDQIVRVWETDTGKSKHELGETVVGQQVFIGRNFGSGDGRDFAFSPDGKILAVGGTQIVRMFDTTTGKELPVTDGHRKAVSSILVTPDGKTLLSWSPDDTFRRWDAATGKELNQFRVPSGTMCADIARDGHAIALALMDSTIRLIDPATGKELHQVKGHNNGTSAITFSPNGKLLATRGADNTIRLFDPSKGTEIRQIALPNANPNMAGGVVFINGYRNFGARTLAFSPDGQTLAAHIPATNVNYRIAGQPAPTPTSDMLHIWDVTTGKEIRKINLPPQRPVTHIAFSPDGRVLAMEGADQSISLLEIASGRERDRLGKATPNSTTVTSTGMVVVGGGFVNYGQQVILGNTLAYSPDGSILAAKTSDNRVRVWDINAAKEIGEFKGHAGAVATVAFAPDGKTLVSGGHDTTILVWDAASLKRVPALPQTELQAKQTEDLWNDLASDDANKAFRGMLRLAAAPKQTPAFMRDRLEPAAPVDVKKIERLITELGSENFKTRTRAMKDLESLGDLAVPALRKALTMKTSLETQRRVEPLLEKLTTGTLSTEQIRLVRAVEVLERLGTTEARSVLERLAQGAAGALPTRQAQTVLDRLNQR